MAGTRLAAVGDLHVTKQAAGVHQPLFAAAAERADILLLCGDLTDHGLPEEAAVLASDLGRAGRKMPTLAVLGNHDVESGQEAEVRRILGEAGVIILDGDAHQVGDVGFVGVKGFCGGFGRHTLEPWGEGAIKAFVRDAVEETLKLEGGLARLRTPHRVALLHYAPIAATVEGEPREIYPFLGSSRLEEPLNRYEVVAAFHGHAHRGALEGKTRDGVMVYNVAAPLLRRSFPDSPPLRIVTLPGSDAAEPAPSSLAG